jgi:hypothetical protein
VGGFRVSWPAAFLALLLSHAAGDVLLQTDWQAVNKVRGLSDSVGRSALLQHISTYTLAFVPALVWIGLNTSAGRAVAVAAIVTVPHLVIDDGRLVRGWLHEVKGARQPGLGLTIAVDQCFHGLCLLGAALLAAA